MGVSEWYAVSFLLPLTTSCQMSQLTKEPTKNIVISTWKEVPLYLGLHHCAKNYRITAF